MNEYYAYRSRSKAGHPVWVHYLIATIVYPTKSYMLTALLHDTIHLSRIIITATLYLVPYFLIYDAYVIAVLSLASFIGEYEGESETDPGRSKVLAQNLLSNSANNISA